MPKKLRVRSGANQQGVTVQSTRARFVLVALAVSLFAVGMVAFLNYYKYRSTVAQMVQSRVLVVGRGIENSIQASLGLGLQFAELGMMPDLLMRERATESLLKRIDVFDHNGTILYSTDAQRVGSQVPREWTAVASRAKATGWTVEDGPMQVAGISLKNNFNLVVGYMALHYPRAYAGEAASKVGRQILLASAAALVGVALLMPLALGFVFRRLEADFAGARDALGPAKGAAQKVGDPQLAQALVEAGSRLKEAEAEFAHLAARVEAAR